MPPILVTGCTGLLGSALTRSLVEDGKTVRVLKRLTSPMELLDGVIENVEQVVGDISDPDAVRQAVAGADVVYHAAAFIGFGGKSDKESLHSVNVRGTANVVNACLDAGVRRLVHTSSQAAIGRPEESVLITEEIEWSNSTFNSEYAKSKYAAELEVRRGIAEGLDAVIVNPSMIFGKGRPGENTVKLLEDVKAEKILGIPAGGTNVVDVRDVVNGHRSAMEKGVVGERYFLGAENISWEDIFRTIADVLGVRPPTRHVSPRLALFAARAAEMLAKIPGLNPQLTTEAALLTARSFRYSNEKARMQLGIDFTPFRQTVERVVHEMKMI